VKLPQEVDDLLVELLSGARPALGENLLGLYLRGSLATGDFIPERSDVDVLAVTERPVDDGEFAALGVLHAHLVTLPNPYANRMEIAYIDRASLRQFKPGRRHPTLGQGETLVWSVHGDNWILERWVMREHGVTLFGPDPGTLIDRVSSDQLIAAVRTRLRDWADWANTPDDPDWSLPRAHKAYVVETMCRALYTLRSGKLSSKTYAVQWALETFREPWRATVERARAWRTDLTVDLTIVPEVRRFVLWAAEGGEGAAV
jgi:hypothetical protein